MRRLILAILALVSFFLAKDSFATDTTYTDPRRPSFSLLVPDGWTAVKTENGVNLKHADAAEVTLFVQGQAIDPSDFIRRVLPQIEQQHKNFRLIEAQGACLFGKESGAYVVYSGIGPKGPALTIKMVVMTNGQLTYVMFEQAPPDKYNDEKSAMQRIQDSFAPEPVAAANGNEKLDALHAAGVLSDEEYATRKRGESTFRDPRQPSYTVAVPLGWRALKNDTGVKLEKLPAGAGVAQVWVQPESHTPSAMIASLERQWKDFRKTDQGEVRFGGLNGAYVVFSGVGSSGKPVIMKMVIATDGKSTFSLFMMTDLDQYNGIKAEWDHIQQSFIIEGITSIGHD